MKNFVRVGTRSVTLVGTVNDWFWYGGDLQAKALLLMLYARLQPDSQLVLGLANDLLAANSSGYWGNTSNAGWVLQAFAEMMDQNKEAEASFTAQVTIGDSPVASSAFKGLSRAPFRKQLSGAELARHCIEAGGGNGGRLPGSALIQPRWHGHAVLHGGASLRLCLGRRGTEGRGHWHCGGNPGPEGQHGGRDGAGARRGLPHEAGLLLFP